MSNCNHIYKSVMSGNGCGNYCVHCGKEEKEENGTAPVIVSPPKQKVVECDSCGAGIGYLPEHVKERNGRDMSGGPDGWKRVKCPRPQCPGHGYIERW